MKMLGKKVIGIWWMILIVVIMSFGAMAGSKPVAGTITFVHGTTSLPIAVHVNVTVSDSMQECVINPIVNTGMGGSFASNLDNLVMKNAPTVRCNGLWNIGDKIWYAFEYNGKNYASPIGFIRSGTGLQTLIPLVLDLERGSSGSDTGSGGSGAGGNGDENGLEMESGVIADASDSSNVAMLETEVIPEEVIINPKVELLLQSSPVDINLIVTVEGRVISGLLDGGRVRIDISELPEGRVVDFREYDITWPFTQETYFDMTNFQSGQYKVQAVVMNDGKIIGASPADTFTLRRPEQEIPDNQNFAGMAVGFSGKSREYLNSPYVALGAYFISFLLVLTALILFAYKRRRYAHEIPLDVAQNGINEHLDSSVVKVGFAVNKKGKK